MNALDLARTLRDLDAKADVDAIGVLAYQNASVLLAALCDSVALQEAREEYEADQGDDGFKQPADLYGIMQRAAELKASLEG